MTQIAFLTPDRSSLRKMSKITVKTMTRYITIR